MCAASCICSNGCILCHDGIAMVTSKATILCCMRMSSHHWHVWLRPLFFSFLL
jgi:hypothetical protein